MANLNESVEQLTASLQELAANESSQATSHVVGVGFEQFSARNLRISGDVETFLNASFAHAEQTRHLSVGTY